MNRNNLEQRPKTINRTHCVALEIRGIMGLFIFDKKIPFLPCTYVDLKKLVSFMNRSQSKVPSLSKKLNIILFIFSIKIEQQRLELIIVFPLHTSSRAGLGNNLISRCLSFKIINIKHLQIYKSIQENTNRRLHFIAVLRSRSRSSRNYLRPGAGVGAEIIF